MAQFIVFLEEPLAPEEEERILREGMVTLRGGGIDTHKLSDTVFLAAGNCLTEKVAKRFEIYTPEGEGGREGLVFEIGENRAGFHSRSTWEWFSKTLADKA